MAPPNQNEGYCAISLEMTKNKITLISKTVLLAVLSLVWFVFIQAEYEMVTKPMLQNDFPVIKGVYAVYFLGIILLILSTLIIFLLFSIVKKFTKLKRRNEI